MFPGSPPRGSEGNKREKREKLNDSYYERPPSILRGMLGLEGHSALFWAEANGLGLCISHHQPLDVAAAEKTDCILGEVAFLQLRAVPIEGLS